MLHPNKQTTEIYKQERFSAGKGSLVLLTVKCQKNQPNDVLLSAVLSTIAGPFYIITWARKQG